MPLRQYIEEESERYATVLRAESARNLEKLGGLSMSNSIRAAVEYALVQDNEAEFLEFLSRYQIESVTPNKGRCEEIYKEAKEWRAKLVKR